MEAVTSRLQTGIGPDVIKDWKQKIMESRKILEKYLGASLVNLVYFLFGLAIGRSKFV